MSTHQCDIATCTLTFPTDRERYLHRMNDHTADERGDVVPDGPTTRASSGAPPAEYAEAKSNRRAARRAARADHVMSMRTTLGLVRFSEATEDGACPRCHGYTFKAKRSAGAKLFGAVFGGIGILAMPKGDVQCESCGITFKRG